MPGDRLTTVAPRSGNVRHLWAARSRATWVVSERFELSVAVLDERAVLSVAGELDLATVADVAAAVGRLVDAGHRMIVLDLAALAFVDAAGLGMMVAASNRLSDLGGTFTVESASAAALGLFHLCSLDHLLGGGQTVHQPAVSS